MIDGHALFSIHWITPVARPPPVSFGAEVTRLRMYASNIARSPSYAAACDFVLNS